ncbi:hypothetical protein AERO_04520 [Aeromicrobium fastidiosum]|uniref:hypothetical protein n=1 Tax=Aeromicrobium fastidiosum TaxID=52699 RepID=UPI002023334A|nr:hypothetical protein [Aeromicrobium fastidiosum]MCL8250639.1 hypothetical protein [Aeromicrobium fastidiosum]
MDDDTTTWTPEGAARLTTAAESLQDAIGEHARASIAAAGDDEAVFRASEELLAALVAYGTAQAEHTGYGFPLLVLEQFVDDDEDDDEDDDDDDEDEDEEPVAVVSVVQRHDYEVVDADAVMAAGRAAYLRVHPGDTDDEASADVSHLGRALYQLAHADGWSSLADADGIDPIGGIVAVARQATPLGPDPDDWVDTVLDDTDDLLHTQDEVYRR